MSVLGIVVSALLIFSAFCIGALAGRASMKPEETYVKGYKEGYKNGVSFAATLMIMTRSVENSD